MYRLEQKEKENRLIVNIQPIKVCLDAISKRENVFNERDGLPGGEDTNLFPG
jgi:hypothetical protein